MEHNCMTQLVTQLFTLEHNVTHSNYCDMMFEINDRNFAIVYSSQQREFKLTKESFLPGVIFGVN